MYGVSSLFPLRIYTALKQTRTGNGRTVGLFPLRIYTALKLKLYRSFLEWGLFPLRIYTALKPSPEGVSIFSKFVSPTNLHCSQTAVLNQFVSILFVSPTNLHCSQTKHVYSMPFTGLFPLRIYTALKQKSKDLKT